MRTKSEADARGASELDHGHPPGRCSRDSGLTASSGAKSLWVSPIKTPAKPSGFSGGPRSPGEAHLINGFCAEWIQRFSGAADHPRPACLCPPQPVRLGHLIGHPTEKSRRSDPRFPGSNHGPIQLQALDRWLSASLDRFQKEQGLGHGFLFRGRGGGNSK